MGGSDVEHETTTSAASSSLLAEKQRHLEEINSQITEVTGFDPARRRFGNSDRRRRLSGSGRQRHPDSALQERSSGGRRAWRDSHSSSTGYDYGADDDDTIDGHRLRSTLANKRPKRGEAAPLQKSSPPPPRPSQKPVDKVTKTRNRRMFSMLMGQLDKAERTEKSASQKKFEEIEKKLAERKKKESEELEAKKRQLFDERRQTEKELITLEQQPLLEEWKPQWAAHYQSLANGSLLTKASPPLFFRPKQHLDGTEALVAEATARVVAIAKEKEVMDWVVKYPARITRGENEDENENDADADADAASTRGEPGSRGKDGNDDNSNAADDDEDNDNDDDDKRGN